MITVQMEKVVNQNFLIDDVSYQSFAFTKICGYLHTINKTPNEHLLSGHFNYDLIFSNIHPRLTRSLDFNYAKNGDREAYRRLLSLGDFLQVHTVLNDEQFQELSKLINKKIVFMGHEVAVSTPINEKFVSYFLQKKSALDLISGLTPELYLHGLSNIKRIERELKTACHFIYQPQFYLKKFFQIPPFFRKFAYIGSGVGGNFSAAATAAAATGATLGKNASRKSETGTLGHGRNSQSSSLLSAQDPSSFQNPRLDGNSNSARMRDDQNGESREGKPSKTVDYSFLGRARRMLNF